MKLNVNYILENSKVQGPGNRLAIWVQGCSIHCIGCKNVDTWPIEKRTLISVNDLIEQVKKSESTGLTITGGEPLDQLEAVLELTKGIFDFKDIFLCSGYTFESIKKDSEKKEILSSIDIICSGPFDHLKVCQSEWKGSSNQEVIYLTERGKTLLNLPIYKREIRINKKTGNMLVTGFSL